MKNIFNKISLLIVVIVFFANIKVLAQPGVPPAPYCFPLYSQIPCNQPGPSNSPGNFINDFINSFSTTGGISNITNNNSGCNAQNFPATGIRNYFYFGCQHYLVANPGQVITATFQSGQTYAQGFTLFVDWDQNGVFNLTNERVCSVPGVPAAQSFNSANFTIPVGQATGTYRMRARCAWATNGPTIDPCLNYGYGETEDYNLYVNMTPAGIITATASTSTPSLCSGQTINLNVLTSANPTTALTYTWSGPGNYTSSVQSPVITNATATMSGVYSVTVSPGSCPATKTVQVTVTDYPTYTVTPLTATVCQGGVLTPSVILGTLPGTPCSTVGLGPPCATPLLKDVGTSTTFNPSWQTPVVYNKYYYDHHQQILYRASELLASGVSAGYLTSMAFNVSATNGIGSLTNFTIKMKCTNATAITAFDNTNLSQVFTQASFAPVNGWNTHTFQTPYYWDGVSNILVDICRGNQPWQFVSASVFYTPTTYVSNIWNGVFGPNQTSCGTAGSQGTSTDRPNTRWGNCVSVLPNNFTYLWTPGPGIAAPTATSTQITTQPITGTVATVLYSVVVTPTVYSCPTLQTLTVTVVNPMSPTITPVAPLCNTFGTVNIIANPPGGVFSTNPAITAAGVINPAIAAIGTSTVLYTVGIGSCIATNTTSIDVSQFNTAALTGSLPDQCNTFTPTNLMTIVQSTVNGVWSGTGVSANVFSPNLPTGVYTLTYNTTSAANATLCPDSKTITVNVLNPPQPTISQVGPYCDNAPSSQLLVSPTTGSWTPTVYNSSTGTFSPGLASIGNNVVTYIIGTNTCNVSDTKTISVEAYVPAVITGTIPDLCVTSSQVNLVPLTTNNLGIWTGSGISGTSFNPATSGVGNIILTYNTASSPSGLCPAQATTAVNVYSLATPAITQVGPFCNAGPPLQLQVSPLGGVFGGANNGATTPSGGFNPSFAIIGDNIINYSVTAGPCVAYAQTTINIEKFVSADLSQYAGPYCRNDAPINLNSIVQNPGGVWSGPGVTGSLFTPASANIGDNNIVTYFTHSMPTASLCPDSSAVRITVNEVPNVSVVSNLEKGCSPIIVTFNTPSANTGTGLWNLGDGSDPMPGLSVTHTFDIPGSYTVTFNYQDDIGCSTQAVLANPIVVYAMPRANFNYNPDEVTIATPEVQFSNLSTVLGANSYQWQIGNLYQLNDVNPKVIFPVAGDYEVTLTATTVNGCKDVLSKMIQVKNDYGIYIPSSFTPNFDGLNDEFIPIFSPYGLDLKTYEMEVFDRWGHSMFHTKDYTIGWNGSVNNKGDDSIKEDVYVYKVRFKDIDGKIHNKTGHVTLMK
ncbi:MAG: gliding motility-associated C-terminal domain-containing protein [Bacteroidia bacterium]|nr:gliding motility-associated C-terminal domain-containing protein [Bacteroidia bacterium]